MTWQRPAASTSPDLPDMARLEWGLHQAHDARDTPPLTPRPWLPWGSKASTGCGLRATRPAPWSSPPGTGWASGRPTRLPEHPGPRTWRGPAGSWFVVRAGAPKSCPSPPGAGGPAGEMAVIDNPALFGFACPAAINGRAAAGHPCLRPRPVLAGSPAWGSPAWLAPRVMEPSVTCRVMASRDNPTTTQIPIDYEEPFSPMRQGRGA